MKPLRRYAASHFANFRFLLCFFKGLSVASDPPTPHSSLKNALCSLRHRTSPCWLTRGQLQLPASCTWWEKEIPGGASTIPSCGSHSECSVCGTARLKSAIPACFLTGCYWYGFSFKGGRVCCFFLIFQRINRKKIILLFCINAET